MGKIVQSVILQRSKSDCKAFLLIWLKKCLDPHKNSHAKVITILLTSNIFTWASSAPHHKSVSFVLTPKYLAYRLAATTFYWLQRGFGDRRQCRDRGNILITVPLPTIIVRHWFFRINVRCGFPNDALILRTFDTFEKYSS